jgi:flavorubredoxin
MYPVEIKKDIYWVGAIDWDLRNFHGYLTQRGSTYNAYLIKDEKTVLVDTVKHYLYEEMLKRIKAVTDPATIDYVICNHVEMDHSGSIPKIMEMCPNATVVTSPNGEKGLKKHYKADWNIKVVNTGEVLDIGKRKLNFVLMPMLHWPDSMATYVPEDKLLLPNDAFGQHIASSERFDDELDWNIVKGEAAKYYANIVLPYGSQVKKALDAISGLKIDMIAPSHGLIWRKNISEIKELYKKWADNETENRAVVIYDTMWHSTEKMAQAVYDAFESAGIKAEMAGLQEQHISDIMTKLMTARYICVGSPTLNNGLLPSVAAFLEYMKGLAPKKRTALAFGSYGWGGQSVERIDEVLRNCGFATWDKIKVQWVPDDTALEEIKARVVNSLKG